MSDPSRYIDVHVYDGKWTHNIKTTTSLEDKCILFNRLYQNIKDLGVESTSLQGLILVVENAQKPSNFDSTNNIYSDDILAEICKRMIDMSAEKQHDIIVNIAEQLSDMYKLGQCPQGRSTRLYQLYLSF
ncbi:MAG: hypothetical protein PHG66_00630 [Candidatus Colwellbacteria bacterium]|nr:hypothetical protein [Candidatus Colwellbacteria bacterium]